MAKEFTSDRRLYLSKEGKVVEHDDPNKSELLVAEGGSLSHEDALKYGLVDEEGNTVEKKAEGESEPAGEQANGGDDLKSMTVPKLKELAAEEEVDLAGVTLKDDIIAAIEKKRAGKE